MFSIATSAKRTSLASLRAWRLVRPHLAFLLAHGCRVGVFKLLCTSLSSRLLLLPLLSSSLELSVESHLFAAVSCTTAASEGDKFCQDVFHRAGRHLGRMVNTLLFPRAYNTVPAAAPAAASPTASGDDSSHVHFEAGSVSSGADGDDGGAKFTPRPALPCPNDGDVVPCVCVGSVWKSFPLLRRGFLETVFGTIVPADASPAASLPVDFTLRLIQLEVSSAVGAAWKAASVRGPWRDACMQL